MVTLATLSIFKGVNIGITEAQPFYGIPEAVKAFGNARIGPMPLLLFVSGTLALVTGPRDFAHAARVATSWPSAATVMRRSSRASTWAASSSRRT